LKSKPSTIWRKPFTAGRRKTQRSRCASLSASEIEHGARSNRSHMAARSDTTSVLALTNNELDSLLSMSDSDLEDQLMRLRHFRGQEAVSATLRQMQERLEDQTIPAPASQTPTTAMTTEPVASPTLTLYEFVRQAWHLVEPDIDFVDGWHIRAICDHLEAVTAGTISNLLINIPPGCCKSLLVCVFWPAWVWTFKPSARWMFTSYAQDLSTRDSLRTRNIVESQWYEERWGSIVQLVGDQNQKTRFDTSATGWRIATSVGGRGTGEHPDFIVGDDPHNVRQSESEAERQAAIDYWDGTIATRGRARGSRRVVIMQRLHQVDLSGHLLAKGGYEHLCLPMRFEVGRMKATKIGFEDPRTEPGELLFPQIFNEQSVDEMERGLGPIRAAGQMQQNPVPAEGAMFNRAWFKPIGAIPAGCSFVRYWDKAGALPGKGDYTAGALVAKAPTGQFYIVDMVRVQFRASDRNNLIKQVAAMDEAVYGRVPIWIEQPPGLAKESTDTIVRELAGHNVKPDPVRKDKIERAEPLQSQCQAGNVFMLIKPWNTDMLDELSVFPFGSHDDQVDALSGAFNKLATPAKSFYVGVA
jgi:predicted phage terminase large subunit-like protein